MRRVRLLLAALLLAAPAAVGTAAPAGAVMCNPEQDPDCDCSVKIKNKVIIPCNY